MNQGTFSDYHDRWNSDPRYSGDCCFGVCGVQEHLYPIGTTRPGIFHQMLLNDGNLADNRLCSRLSKN